MSDSDSYDFDTEKFYHEIKRCFNILSDESQSQKYKETLIKIQEIIEKYRYDLNEQIIQRILREQGQILLQCFSFKKEKVRELSIMIYEDLISRCEDVSQFLSEILQKLEERLNCYDLEGLSNLPEIMRPSPSQAPLRIFKLVEESEEVRFKLCQFLKSLFEIVTKEQIRNHLDLSVDCIRVLCMDPFSKIQLLACQTMQLFCENYQALLLHFSEILARSLLLPLVSKKSKIRMAALNSLGSVLLCGVWKKNNAIIEMLIGFKDPNSVPIKAFYEPVQNINYFATLLEDQKDSVRELFIRQIGDWIIRLPDRWDHYPRTVPYILSGVTDKNIEIAQLAISIIEECGRNNEQENEKDFREQKQYGIESDWTLNGEILPFLSYPSPFTKRPCTGARVFIRSQVRKFWKALYAELRDWKDVNKVSSSYLLWVSVFYAEDYMTQYADDFLKNIMPYSIIHSPNQLNNPLIHQIINNVTLAIKLMGRYLQFKTYFQIVKPFIQKQMNLDIDSVKFSIQSLYYLVLGDLEIVLPNKGLQQKINIPVQIFEFFSNQEVLESIEIQNVDPLNQLLMHLFVKLNHQATSDELNLIYDNHNCQIVKIISNCVFVKYLQQHFVYDNSLKQETIQQIELDILNIQLIQQYFIFVAKINKLEQNISFLQSYLEQFLNNTENISFLNLDFKLIYFILVSSLYINQDFNQIKQKIIEKSQQIFNQMISNKSQSLILTNSKFNFFFLKMQLEKKSVSSSIFEQQIIYLKHLINLNKDKKMENKYFNIINLFIQQLSYIFKESLECLKINNIVLQNYCEIISYFIELQSKQMNKEYFKIILRLTEKIMEIAQKYEQNFQEDFNFEEKEKKQYGIFKLFEYCISCYGQINDSTDISHIDEIFELFRRVVAMIQNEKITSNEQVKDFNDIYQFVNTLIKNCIDEQNQYINQKLVDLLKTLVNKQRYFFEKEYVLSIKNHQYGRVHILKSLLNIK